MNIRHGTCCHNVIHYVQIYMRVCVEIRSIKNLHYVFAAKLEDGSVVVWGKKYVKLQFMDVDTIQCTAHACAVKLKNGSVVTWGEDSYVETKAVQSQLKNIVTMYSSAYTFAAKLTDGSIVTWGNERRLNRISYTGDVQSIATESTNKRALSTYDTKKTKKDKKG